MGGSGHSNRTECSGIQARSQRSKPNLMGCMQTMDLASTDIATPDASQGGTPSTPIQRTGADANGDVGHWLRTAAQARQDGRPADARALLEAVAEQFPQGSGVRRDLARLLEAGRDWSAAEHCWRAYVALEPSAWWGSVDLAHALREQGRLDEAEVLLAALRDGFPEEVGVFSEYARIAGTGRRRGCAGRTWRRVSRTSGRA